MEGIGKLIELLNEYAPDYCKDYPDDMIMDEIVISKRFGFIKWLVDNDKIDKEFEDKKFLGDIFDSGYRYNNSFIEDRLLCYLALTDEPIEFLISVLK